MPITIRAKEGIFLSVHNAKQPTKDEDGHVTKADSLPLAFSPDGNYLLVNWSMVSKGIIFAIV